MPDLQTRTWQLSRLGLPEQQLHDMMTQLQQPGRTVEHPRLLSALEQADHEDEIAVWLDDYCGVEDAWEKAATFVDSGFTLANLREQVRDTPASQLGPVLSWLNCAHLATHLLEEIEQSVTRISTLIGTVKAYTFMDQAPVQPVDIHQGLENTLSMLHNELGNVQIMRGTTSPSDRRGPWQRAKPGLDQPDRQCR